METTHNTRHICNYSVSPFGCKGYVEPAHKTIMVNVGCDTTYFIYDILINAAVAQTVWC
jgi:hypothetical protein